MTSRNWRRGKLGAIPAPQSGGRSGLGVGFYVGFGLAFGLAALQPLSYLVGAAERRPEVWYFNDIVHSIYHPILFPAAFGLLVDSLPLGALAVARRSQQVLCIALLVLLLIPIGLLLRDDADREPVAPYYMRTVEHRGQAFRVDACLRLWVRTADTASMSPCAQWGARVEGLTDTSWAGRAERAVKSYSAIVRNEGWFVPTEGRSTAHILTVSLTGLGALGAALFLWLVVSIGVILPNPFRNGSSEASGRYVSRLRTRLVLAFALLVAWLPTAVYNNWYGNFFTLSRLPQQNFVVVSFVATFFGTFILLLILKPRNAGERAKVFGGAVGSVFGGIVAFKPELLQGIASALGALGFSGYAGVVVITAVAAVVGVQAFLSGPEE